MKVIKRSRSQVFTRWVKALRSSKYKQAQGQLKKDDGFCCLGVLCDLAVKDGGKPWGISYHNDSSVGIHEAYLPEDMSEFLFGKQAYDIQDFLAGLNDNYNYNFKEIADVIEKIKTDLEYGIEFEGKNYK